jgi:uncharacterized protein (DUF2336 family)
MDQNLIEQLEGALSSKDLSRRADMLRQVTDLFIQGSGFFTGEQVTLFGNVMGMLVENIEVSARAAFGSRLAQISDAPRNMIRALAFDDAIEVAAPVLVHSEQLDDDALLESARTKSQGHLLAIAGRKVLTEPVTDVLIDRGSPLVVTNTAANSGARFSNSGFSTLVSKAENDGDLALCVWLRPDIPRHDLIRLFAQASEAVKGKLEAADPRRAGLIRNAVAAASDEIQTRARLGSDEHAQAQSYVRSLHASGQLDEARLHDFVSEGSFDRTTVALSLMCDLPIGVTERALVQGQSEQLIVVAKAIDLSWQTTRAVLVFQAGRAGVAQERLDEFFTSYSRLQSKTAQTALKFYRLRERANASSGH